MKREKRGKEEREQVGLGDNFGVKITGRGISESKHKLVPERAIKWPSSVHLLSVFMARSNKTIHCKPLLFKSIVIMVSRTISVANSSSA